MVNKLTVQVHLTIFFLQIGFPPPYPKRKKRGHVLVNKLKVQVLRNHLTMFCSGLLTHPVLACFIALKWHNLKWYFWAQTFLFLFFLASYYFYIIDIFMEDQSRTQNKTDSNQTQTQTLSHFLEELPATTLSWFELVFAICTIMLILYELYQMYWTGFGNYIKDIENWVQNFVYATAIDISNCKQTPFTLYL